MPCESLGQMFWHNNLISFKLHSWKKQLSLTQYSLNQLLMEENQLLMVGKQLYVV